MPKGLCCTCGFKKPPRDCAAGTFPAPGARLEAAGLGKTEVQPVPAAQTRATRRAPWANTAVGRADGGETLQMQAFEPFFFF